MFACTVFSARGASTAAPHWREIYKGRYQQITAVLAVVDQLVFLDSPFPLAQDGGDVCTWDFARNAAVRRFSLDEQGAYQLRAYGRTVYIAGVDATQDFSFGNFYVSTDAGLTWAKRRTIPNAVHVLDICERKGQLIVGADMATPNGGTVSFSKDGGQTWEVELVAPADAKVGDSRVYLVVPMLDGIYAFWQTWSGPRGWSVRTSSGWKTAKLPGLPTDSLVPAAMLPDGRISLASLPRWRQIGRGVVVFMRSAFGLLSTALDARVVGIPSVEATPTEAWVFKNYQDMAVGKDDTLYALTPRGVAVGSLEGLWKGAPGFKHLLELPAGQLGWSMAYSHGKLFVGTQAADGGRLLTLEE